MRRTVLAGILGATTAVGAVSAFTIAQAAPQPAEVQQTAADAAMSSAVEDFNYPDAERILKEKGIKLGRGDGHIILSECKNDDIRVWTTSTSEDGNKYCFKVTGKSGYLTLEVPETFGVQALDRPVEATLTSDGKKQTVKVTEGTTEQVGVGDGRPGASGKEATLVELRVKG
ncbi:hypothetical protein [Streptomyces paromomycinus]|nr:hypothetical protein [Streptomyces paromomycinus]